MEWGNPAEGACLPACQINHVRGLGFRTWGLGCRIQGLGFLTSGGGMQESMIHGLHVVLRHQRGIAPMKQVGLNLEA